MKALYLITDNRIDNTFKFDWSLISSSTSHFQMTLKLIFITYEMNGFVECEINNLKYCLMCKSKVLKTAIQNVSLKLLYSYHFNFYIIFSNASKPLSSLTYSLPFPSSTWHYESIHTLPVKFIRTNSFCEVIEQYKTASFICFCLCI